MSSRKSLTKMTPADKKRASKLRALNEKKAEIMDGYDGRPTVESVPSRRQLVDRYLREVRIHHAYDPHAEHRPARRTPSMPEPQVCPQCSSQELIRNGGWATNNGRTQRYICKECGLRYGENE